MPYYAIINGRETGVVKGWPKCQASVSGYSNAWYRKFNKKAEALEYFQANKSDSDDDYLTSIDTSDRKKHCSAVPGKLKKDFGTEHIYIAGACKGNGMVLYPKTGYGVFYGDGDERNDSVPLSEDDYFEQGTNQKAELYALEHALIDIDNIRGNQNPTKAYTIHTDSQYVIKATGVWSKEWEANDWRTVAGNSVANKDLIKKILFYLKHLNEKSEYHGLPLVKLDYVRGHAGNHGIEMANKLANEAAEVDGILHSGMDPYFYRESLEYFEANKDQSDSDSEIESHSDSYSDSLSDPYSDPSDPYYGTPYYGWPIIEIEPDAYCEIENIYIDGACRGNGKYRRPKSGYGVYYGEGDERNASVPLSKVDKLPGTNQRAELHALNHVLDNIDNFLKVHFPETRYVIHTDSQYVIKATGVWAKKWKSNGWHTVAGKPVANQDLIKKILAKLEYINKTIKYENQIRPIEIKYVPGHAGDIGNEMADKLANEGADKD